MISRRQFLAILGSGAAVGGVAVLGVQLLPDSAGSGLFPTVRYGREPCSFCGMTINDARFAAAWRGPSGERHFDDIGCMAGAYHRDHPADRTQFFVHDYRDESWLDASLATFVISSEVKSPMGYGVAAVATPAAARDLAPRIAAAPVPWDQLLSSLERKS